MYLALTTEGVGKVERGNITEMYPSNTTLQEVYDGTAEQTQSEKVGDRVKSTELVKLTRKQDKFQVQGTMGGDQSTILAGSENLSRLKQRATKELVL